MTREPFTAPGLGGRRDFLKAGGKLALGLAGAAATLASAPAFANDLRLGQPAPPLVLKALDGRSIATRDLQGQVVLATFWATWCVPCREELPLLSAFAQRHAAEGLQVLGFGLDTPAAMPKVREVAATLSFPVGLMDSPYAGGYGRIWHLPVSFVIDRAGRLAHNGWDDEDPSWTEESLQRVVLPLLRA